MNYTYTLSPANQSRMYEVKSSFLASAETAEFTLDLWIAQKNYSPESIRDESRRTRRMQGTNALPCFSKRKKEEEKTRRTSQARATGKSAIILPCWGMPACVKNEGEKKGKKKEKKKEKEYVEDACRTHDVRFAI